MRFVATRAVALLVMVALVGCNPTSGPIAVESPTAPASTTAPATTAAATSAAPTATTAAPTQAPTQAPTVAPTPTSAPTPSPTPTSNLAAPPPCPTGAPDPSLPVCTVSFSGTGWQALTSQSILFRIRQVNASQADCAANSAATTRTFTIDGASVPVTTIPCYYVAPAWFTDFSYLSGPGALAPGVHTETATITYNTSFSYSLDCTDPSGRCTVAAGTVNRFTSTLTITR